MLVNILQIIIQKLIEEIKRRDFYKNFNFQLLDTNNIFNKIIKNLNEISKYIKKSDEEIERLGSENNRLNSELVKIHLELMEYKKRDYGGKKRKNKKNYFILLLILLFNKYSMSYPYIEKKKHLYNLYPRAISRLYILFRRKNNRLNSKKR